jgi:hypothetical protein
MSEKPKEEKENKAEKPETGDKSSWSEAQREKSYYYDDGCGYEVYNPDAEEDDEEVISNK